MSNDTPPVMVAHSYERGAFLLAILAAVICLVGPLLVIATWERPASPGELVHASEATVGIGVILRATFRRIFRATARNFFRTTFSAVTRASARTFTRRLVRFVLRMFFGVIAKQSIAEAAETPVSTGQSQEILRNPTLSLYAIAISFVALAISFWGVLQIATSENAMSATTDRGLPVLLACILAATPIVVYGLATYVLASWLKMGIRFACELDALLLQAYFTGAGSFLPMTTDVEYNGTKRQNATLATAAIAVIYGCHLGLLAVAQVTDFYAVEFASSMFLVYAFVYAFPIAPLEGHEVWVQSKLLWCCLFFSILTSFFLSFPALLTPLL
ncbi:MAG: hypothetical protein WD070_05170 [Pirellulaceae bacterium]